MCVWNGLSGALGEKHLLGNSGKNQSGTGLLAEPLISWDTLGVSERGGGRLSGVPGPGLPSGPSRSDIQILRPLTLPLLTRLSALTGGHRAFPLGWPAGLLRGRRLCPIAHLVASCPL